MWHLGQRASERACALDRRSLPPAPFIRLTAVFAAWGQGFAAPVRSRASIVNYGRDPEPQQAQEDECVPQWAAQGPRPARRQGGFWDTEVRRSRASDHGG